MGGTEGQVLDDVVYRETQRIRQWWAWVIVAGVTLLGWWIFIQQIILGRAVGDDPLPDSGVWVFWAFLGLGSPVFLGSVALVTQVTSRELVVRFRPLTRRAIPLSSIREATARTYSPLREYGGWGVKGWSRRNMAYNISGDRGVQLVLEDGRRVLVGSQRAEELARIIETQRLAEERKL